MKLDSVTKQTLLHHAEEIHRKYLALDFMRSKEVCQYSMNDSDSRTLLELCRESIDRNNFKQEIWIADKSYELTLSCQKNSTFAVTLARPLADPSVSTKAPNKYTDRETATLLAQQTFVLDRDSSAVRLDADSVIGGPGKIELYRTHLVTLNNIIQKIRREEDVSAMLVALATGTGKTFVQALWMHILYRAKLTGIFTMPDHLVTQFCSDMRRLLADDVVERIQVVRGIDAKMPDLQTPGQIIVASSKYLLDHHYDALLAAPTDHTFITVDEQHVVMRYERQKIRLFTLSEKFLALFLTATPTRETYEFAGSKPVAIMSPGQKQQANQGHLPVVKPLRASFMLDLNRKHTSKWKSKIFNELMMRLGNLVFKDVSSSSRTVIDQLPFQIFVDAEETNLRWGVQVPMARKMLCLIDDNDSLVNFFHEWHKKPDSSENKFPMVYHEGDLSPNGGAGTLLASNKDAITDLIDAEHDAIWQSQCAGLSEAAADRLKSIAQRGLLQQVCSNMFHYLVEYVLMDITEMSQIEQNQRRKKSLPDFVKLVRKKAQIRTQDYYAEKLTPEIGYEATQDIAPLLTAISRQMPALPEDNYVQFCDNWFLDQDIYTTVCDKGGYFFQSKFEAYTKKYQVISVMAGMQDAETPIVDSQPFSHMEQEESAAFEEGHLSSTAKKRPRGSIEQLAGLMGAPVKDIFFKPQYSQTLTEDMADQLFKYGFVGCYVSNKKSIGFNDPNLHTVMSVIEHNLAMNNSPRIQIQSTGRLRGLDDTQKPAYIHVLGRSVQPQFDLALLEQEDYYPDYFKAQARYDEAYTDFLGEELTDKLMLAYFQHKKADGSINKKQLKRDILKLIASSLRALNAKNNFDVHLSRTQMSRVIAKAMDKIEEEIARIQHPYPIASVIRAFISTFQSSFSLFNYRENARIAKQLSQHEKSLSDTPVASPDKTYLKIIRATKLEKITAQAAVILELSACAKQKLAMIETAIDTSREIYLQEGASNRIFIDTPFSWRVFARSLNWDKVADLAIGHLVPILFHPEMLLNANMLIGQLQEEDLALIFKSSGQSSEEAQASAQRMLLFVDILRTKDSARLKDKFMTMPNMDDSFDANTLPAKRLLQDFFSLVEEITACFCHYHRCTITGGEAFDDEGALVSTGSLDSNARLLRLVSADLRAIRLPYRKNELGASLALGAVQGAGKTSRISAAANTSTIEALQEVKADILRPLWWQIKVSRLQYTFVSGLKNLFFAIKDLGLRLWDGLKALAQWVHDCRTSPAPDQQMKAAIDPKPVYEFARRINRLRPLNATEANEQDCPEDMVVGLEHDLEEILPSSPEEERGSCSMT
ncbi:MAG: DEAD/DEAH box helicase family protein [Gammaproteobacteria bacterium]|nr:DEAD/DEAH box helicase family protein [Gammaproteobacteria bacterium]